MTWENFMNLGRINDNDHLEKFSMSILAAKLSSEINGVSRIHGRVSRQLFSDLYPGYFPEELHIGYVTNGVHFPTWVSKRWKKLYDAEFGECYIGDQSNPDHWKKIYNVPDEKIWQLRQKHRKDLIVYLKTRLVDEMTRRQENPKNIFKTNKTLSETVLTIGFARRFATYKRAHLLFSNLERLARIVNNIDKPVQFVFAGKAHPNDKAGQDLIKRIFEITRRPEFLGKIIFLENYDIDLGKRLTQGVDVWLNTPTRPLEASGTSGEKAIMNGVANFSVLDGWWAEGYKPDAGWALKEERTYQDQPIQDELDAETIYNIIENEIVPAFYGLNDQGVPEKWVAHIKNTIALITPHFTMKRMVDDYYNKYYLKMFGREQEMTANNFENAKKMAAWKQKMLRGWESIEVVSVNMTDTNKNPLTLGETFHAEIVLKMNELSGADIGIEIIFGQKVNDQVERITHMQELKILSSNCNVITYACDIHAERVGVFDFAFRMFPRNAMMPHRQDFNLIKWL
jgi:alpha-glucan phosphorylase-like protein